MFKTIAYTCFLLLFFASCEKETSSYFIPNNNALNDTTWQTNTLTNNVTFAELAMPVQKYSFNCGIVNTIKLNDSVDITIPAWGCLNSYKQSITTATEIVIAAKISSSKEALIRNTISANSYLQLVDVFSHFEIALSTKTGETVYWDNTKSIQIKLQTKATISQQILSSIKAYTGSQIKYNNSNWITHFLPFNAAQFFLTTPIGSSNLPQIGMQTTTIANLGVGKLLETNGTALNRCNIILPPNYTNKNTQCFVVLQQHNTVIQLFAEPTQKYFYALNIPANMPAYLVSISKIDNSFYLGLTGIVLQNANPIKLAPIKLSAAQLIEKLQVFR